MAERGEPTRTSALARVRKRDGREVPFDVAKIRAAVLKATAAVGDADAGYAAEVAALVELALREEQRGRGRGLSARPGSTGIRPGGVGTEDYVPTIEEIQDLVERALVETGRAAVAKAYILYRDERARVREALRVESGARGDLSVQDGAGASAWSKGRIVAALMTEAELSRSSAAEIASAVEQKVFDTRLGRITTGLVRELVDIELASRGWTSALRRQEPVNFPRHDLRRALAGMSLHAWDEEGWRVDAGDGAAELAAWPAELGDGIEGPVAGEVLTRFALREVLDEPLADMHITCDLHVEDLGRPHLPLVLSVTSELVARGEPTAGGAFALLEELSALASQCAFGLVLEDPGSVLQPLARGTRTKSPLGLAAWLRSAGALALAARRHVDLGSPGERFSAFTARLVEEFSLLPANAPFSPRLFLDFEECTALVREFPQVADSVDRLCVEGRIVLTWGTEEERFAGPGCRRIGREHGALATAAAVALNLPRIARRAGPWREDLALELLQGSVQCAIAVCRSLESARAAWNRRTSLRTRDTYALVPVGLRESLRILGDGEIDPGLGARLVGFVNDAARRFAADAGLSAVVSPFFGQRAARRLAFADREILRRRALQQGELFAASSVSNEAPYTVGFRLSPVPGREPGEAEAELVSTLPSGALHPSPARTRGPGEVAVRPPWKTWARRQRTAAVRERDLFVPMPPPEPIPREAATADSRSPSRD